MFIFSHLPAGLSNTAPGGGVDPPPRVMSQCERGAGCVVYTHTHTHAFARTPLMRPLINFHRLNGGKSNYAPHVSTVGQLARRLPAAYGAESRSGGASGRFCWSPTGLTGPEGSRQLLTGHLGRGGRKCGRSGCSHILFLLRRRRIL